MNNKVKFLRGTSGEYAVAEKDSDTIYFTTDDGKLYIGDKEVSGSDIIIDDTLSDTSTNPVQNKVVKQAIDNKADSSHTHVKADITDFPTSLPANGGNADTVDNFHADDFVNANDRDQIQIPSNVDVPAWIYANGKRYQLYITNNGNIGLTNVPNDSRDWVWYWFDGINIFAREWTTGKYYICDMINGSFSGWKDIYTSGNKPYVTGTVTITDTKTTITTNHGFIPSAVFWWKNSSHSDLIRDYALNSAIEFTDSTITIDYRETSPSSGINWTLYYIIFK